MESEVKRQLTKRGVQNVDIVYRELIRGLLVKDLEEPGGLPVLLDEAWHQAILNTQGYALLCTKLGRGFIHHTTESEADSNEAKQARINKTKNNYRKRFRADPPGEIWGDDDEGVQKGGEEKQKEGGKKRGREKEEVQPTWQLIIKDIAGGNVEVIKVSPSTTCATLLQLVATKVGAPVAKIRLVSLGHKMESNSLACAEFGLSNNGIVHLIRMLGDKQSNDYWQIFIKTLDGSTKTINMVPTMTCSALEDLISQKMDIPIDEMRLISEGRQLEGGQRTCADWGLSDQATIHLIKRLRGC